jgi:hypothetical protein
MVNVAAHDGGMRPLTHTLAFALGAVVGCLVLIGHALASMIPNRGWE